MGNDGLGLIDAPMVRQHRQQPSNEQLALFARRLRRTMRDEQGRGYFGIANAEHEFSFFPDVVRVVEWIERLSAPENQARPSLRKPIVGAPDVAAEAKVVESRLWTERRDRGLSGRCGIALHWVTEVRVFGSYLTNGDHLDEINLAI